MKKTTPPKAERSPSQDNHGTNARRTEVATSKASMAVAQDSLIGAISALDTTAERLLTDVERTPISTVTPA